MTEAATSDIAHDEAVGRVRAAILQAGHHPVDVVVRQLLDIVEQAGATLHEMSRVLDAPSVQLEVNVNGSGAQAMDLPPIPLVLVPPTWARVTQALLARWAEHQVRQACGEIIDRAAMVHLHVVRAWATDTLVRIRRAFESERRSLLAQLTAVAAAIPLDRAAGEALREDLEWLRGEDDGVRFGSAPRHEASTTGHQG